MFIVFLLNAIVSFTAVLYYGGSLIDFQFDHFEGNFTVCLHNGNHEGEINFSAKSTRFALAFTKSADIIVVFFKFTFINFYKLLIYTSLFHSFDTPLNKNFNDKSYSVINGMVIQF